MNNPSSASIAEVFSQSFKKKCLGLVEEGYRLLQKRDISKPSWDEERFTEELYPLLRDLVRSSDYPFMDVDFENYDISEVSGEVSRIDFKIRMVTRENQIYAYLECKLLSNNSRSIHGYRREGILRFINGKYAPRPEYDGGFMVGYICSDDINKIASKLGKSIGEDDELNVVEPFTHIQDKGGVRVFESGHQRNSKLGNITLSHILLDFT